MANISKLSHHIIERKEIALPYLAVEISARIRFEFEQ